jgi:ATP synthase protein I
MSRDDNRAGRLQDLDSRIKAARAAQQPEVKPRKQNKYAGAALAWRMLFELVVGITIGFWMGRGLDSLFGTLPLFLILFTLLGFAAGVRVMLQSAREEQRKMDAAAAKAAGQDGTKGASAPPEEGR